MSMPVRTQTRDANTQASKSNLKRDAIEGADEARETSVSTYTVHTRMSKKVLRKNLSTMKGGISEMKSGWKAGDRGRALGCAWSI